MLQEISIAVTAYRFGARRYGTAGGLAFAVLAVVGVTYLRRYLSREHPEAERRLDAAL